MPDSLVRVLLLSCGPIAQRYGIRFDKLPAASQADDAWCNIPARPHRTVPASVPEPVNAAFFHLASPLHDDTRKSGETGRGVLYWLVLVVGLGVLGPGMAAGPKVVSTDLCSDLLLLQIAHPQQILSVSAAARNPDLSPLAERAARYPANRGSVEELLRLSPDIALVYQGWNGRGHGALLARRAVQVVPLPYPSNWPEALAIARRTAELIGRVDEVERLVAQAERRIATLSDRLPPLRVLYLRPNGGSAGLGTYVDDLLRRLGLRNIAAEQGMRGWGRFPLEHLVGSPPDVFLLGYFDQVHPRSKSAYGRHPVLRDLLDRVPVVHVPGGGWGCGGIEMVEVAEHIVAQVLSIGPGVSHR